MDVHNLGTVKRVRITWDENRDREGYLPDIRKVDAKNVDVHQTVWTFEGKQYFELHLQWFSESVRPLKKFEAQIFSGNIIKMTIDN